MLIDIRIDDWSQLKYHVAYFRGYLFRGQASASWGLKTSIERIAARNRLPFENLLEREAEILRDFMRRAHLVMSSPPGRSEWLEWQAAIQHYGGPTRLLDFTRSLYVASFFAVEGAHDDAAVWAIDSTIFAEPDRHTERSDPIDGEIGRFFFQERAESALKRRNPHASVLPLEPYRFNERMMIQKGVFLFPTDVTLAFEKNLEETIRHTVNVSDATDRSVSLSEFLALVAPQQIRATLLRLMLPRKMHREILDDLDDMNIHAAALFPGIDGVARHLQRHLRCW
jgi:hypothetical protein